MSREVLGPVVLAALTLALSGRARRAVWAMLRGTGGVLVIPAALLAERRRARREPPLRLPAGYAWRCALYVAHAGRMHRLAGGTVTGPWTTSVDVEREVMARWVAVNGWPAVGRLCCRADAYGVYGSTSK